MKTVHSAWLATAALLSTTSAIARNPAPRTGVAPERGSVVERWRVPLRFVENQGQWRGDTRFAAQRPGLTLRLRQGELVLELARRDGEETRAGTVRLAIEGASANARLEGEQRSLATSDFFLGSDAARWRTGVPSFASVLYRDLLPGVDLRVRDGDGWPEYDLLLAPGADPAALVMRCEGVEALELEAEGSLVLRTRAGSLRQSAPATWQVLETGERRAVACRYRLLGTDRFGFELEGVDPELPLVIDPGLAWASYFGGSGDEGALSMALTASGAPVVAGMTLSPDLPPPQGETPIQPGGAGGWDAFVALFDPSGATLLESTYLGGSGDDGAFDVAVDGAGRVVLAGFAYSANFPTTAGAYDASLSGAIDGFVSVLDFSLTGANRLVSSTLFGGGNSDWIGALRVDAAGVATVAGVTQSSDLPVTPNAFDATANGGRDLFVARLDLSRTGSAQLVWSTYFGGSGHEAVEAPTLPSLPVPPQIWASLMDLALDGSGRVTLTASTASANLPVTANAFRASYVGPGATGDGFVSTFDPAASGAAQLVWSTYFGGNGAESGHGVALDPAGRVAVGGYTQSADFPVSANAFDASLGGGWDGFLLVLDPMQSGAAQLRYGSFLGGLGRDGVTCVRPAGPDRYVLTGFTSSSDYPTTPNAFDASSGGGDDVPLTVLDTSEVGAAQLLYSSFFGGSGDEGAVRGELATDGDFVFAGWTTSADYPATAGAFATTPAGGTDVAVARFELELEPGTPYCFGDGSGTSCPCFNTGAPGQGCANGSGQGAVLAASGWTSVALDDLAFACAQLLPNQPALLFAGANAVNGGHGVAFGDGLRCAGGGVVRLGIRVPNAMGNATWGPGLGAIASWQAGDVRRFQSWYRNPGTSPCGANFNLSNGYEIHFVP